MDPLFKPGLYPDNSGFSVSVRQDAKGYNATIENLRESSSSEPLTVPRPITSLQELHPGHQCGFEPFLEPVPVVKLMTQLIEGLDSVTRCVYPGFHLMFLIKTYPSGSKAGNYTWVPSESLLYVLKNIVETQSSTSGIKWTGGYSGLFVLSPEPHSLFDNTHPALPYSTIAPVWSIPLLDLDIPSSKDFNQTSGHIIQTLTNHQFPGWIVESGGGLHWVGDVLMPFYPFSWQFYGLALDKITNPSAPMYSKIQAFANKLQSATTESEAIAASQQILHELPSRTHYWSPDPRQIAHRIIEHTPVLRALPGKEYTNPPMVIGRIT